MEKKTAASHGDSVNLNEILRRLRVLEERYSNLRKKSQLSDQNMLEDTRRIFNEIQVIQDTIQELKKDLTEISTKMHILAEEIQSSVPKRELKVLSKYMEFWEPLDFITREEAIRIINEYTKS